MELTDTKTIIMRLLLIYFIIFTCVCLYVQARKKPRKLNAGDGIHFPKRPLSKTETESKVFNKKLYFIYRLANPLIEAHKDVELVFQTQANGEIIDIWDARINGSCVSGTFLFNPIATERNRAVYTSDGPFPTTGKGLTISFFSSNPEEYIFIFYCLDRTKEVVRHGRRMFCDGPWVIIFAMYEFPPDKVKWCPVENDLWRKYCLTFDNEYMKFESSGIGCPDGGDDEDFG